MQDNIIGSYFTHNHPKDETYYSFSAEDIEKFFENKYSVMRGVDDIFEYEISKLPHTVENIIKELKNEFYRSHLSEARETFKKMSGKEDDSKEAAYFAYDYINKMLSEEYGYEYKRKNRDY